PELRIRGALDPLPEGQELRHRARREPTAQVRAPPGRLHPLLALGEEDDVGEERRRVVDAGLRALEQTIESGDITAGGARAEGVRLDERRARAGERIPDELARRRVALEEDLGELGDELAEIRMEPVDVLRPLPLGQLLFGPR